MKQKPGISKPEGGVRFPVGTSKKQTSFPDGDGKDGKAGNLNGKDPANTRDAYRENNRPSNWRRKTGAKHADEAAKREQC